MQKKVRGSRCGRVTSEAELGPTSAGFGRHVCGAVVREHLRAHSLGCPEELPLAVRRLRREPAAVVLGDARRRRELLLEAVPRFSLSLIKKRYFRYISITGGAW